MTRSEKIRNYLEIAGGLAATAHELYRDFADRYQMPELVLEIRNKKFSGTELTTPEIIAERIYVMNMIRVFENQWYQNSIGVLDDEIFRGYIQTLGPFFQSRIDRDLYLDVFNDLKRTNALHPEFVALAEEYIE